MSQRPLQRRADRGRRAQRRDQARRHAALAPRGRHGSLSRGGPRLPGDHGPAHVGFAVAALPALPGRANIVVSRRAGWTAEGAQVAPSLQAALRLVWLRLDPSRRVRDRRCAAVPRRIPRSMRWSSPKCRPISTATRSSRSGTARCSTACASRRALKTTSTASTSRCRACSSGSSESQPDVACLQELKTPDDDVPERRDPRGRLRRDLARPEELQRRGHPRPRREPVETRAAAGRSGRHAQPLHRGGGEGELVVGCLYLPNGNPAAGPKFDYKLAWFERLIEHAQSADRPRRAGGARRRLQRRADRRLDIYKPELVAQRRAAAAGEPRAYRRLLAQGWTDAIRTLHPEAPIYTFWDYFRNRWQRNAGLRIDHLLLNARAAPAGRRRRRPRGARKAEGEGRGGAGGQRAPGRRPAPPGGNGRAAGEGSAAGGKWK